jgi:hypothetical protein
MRFLQKLFKEGKFNLCFAFLSETRRKYPVFQLGCKGKETTHGRCVSQNRLISPDKLTGI